MYDMFQVSGCNGTPVALPWPLPGLEIIALDRDADNGYQNDEINCEILPGFASHLFEFEDPKACKTIRQLVNIDVDGSPQYMSVNLSLSIEDKFGLRNSGKIYITIYDINDNAPQFSPSVYEAEIDGQ